MIAKRLLMASAVAAAFIGTAQAQDGYERLPGVDVLPKGTIRVSPVVPGMGEHWANPRDLPLGPIYCVHQGKVVCLEFMISQADLAAGKSWPHLAGIKNLPPIDHVNMGFEAKGHEGYEVPHYDVHIYFISPEALAKIK